MDWLPPVDIVETETEYAVTLEVCGVSREAMDVRLEDGRLTVSGMRPGDAEGEVCRHRERPVGRFARSFFFRGPVDADAIQASLAEGVLTLTIPKKQPTQVRLG
jgi:HSP20 family protein